MASSSSDKDDSSTLDHMASAITLIAKYKVKDRTKLAEVKTLIARFVERVHSVERDTCLQYSWTLMNNNNTAGGGNDASLAVVLCCQESYVDVPAILRHLGNVGDLFAPFLALVDLDSSEVHVPNPMVRQELQQTPIGQWNAAFYETL